MSHINTRHREGVYCCDCDCPDCECQRGAILLGADMAAALPAADRRCHLPGTDALPVRRAGASREGTEGAGGEVA